MEITTLGAQYLDSSHIPLSSSPASVNPYSQGQGGFEEILKRTRDSKLSPEGESPAPAADRGVPFSKKPEIDKTDKLYEACMELETFLIKNLLKSMRNTVQKTNFIDTGFAGEMYEDMLYDEYAKSYARNAGLGFAEMAYRDLAGLR